MSSSILRDAETGILVDVHRAPISGDIGPALAGMIAVDSGAIANPDEGRMVGHYWLRDPGLAPTPDIKQQIENTRQILYWAAVILCAHETCIYFSC